LAHERSTPSSPASSWITGLAAIAVANIALVTALSWNDEVVR
jgi:hypothetical protein